MDILDHGKNHSSVHESQVHICHKCGWPFPNPHPSAKHRRSHKKICGTIEGYKLINSTASDDEPLSDEYHKHKTPISQVPKVMESCNLKKNISGIGAMSNRSEDEGFSDAAMEFQDGGYGFGRQDSLDHATKSDKDLTAAISFKDCEDTYDVIPIETEPLMDVSEESRKVGGGDKVTECSVRQETDTDENASKSENAEQESDRKGNPEINLGRNLMDVVASNGEHSCVTSEKTDDVTSETPLAGTFVEVKENGDRLTLDTGINDLSVKAESAKDIDASTYTFQIPTDVIQLDKGSDTLGKTFIMLPDASQVVTVPEDIPIVENANIELEGFKDHNTAILPRPEAIASEEIIIDEEKSVESIVKDELVEGKADWIQLDKGSDTLGSFVDANATENEKGPDVCSLEEKHLVYVSDDLDEMSSSGSMINVLPNVNPVVSHTEDYIPESARTGVFGIAEDENTRRTDNEYHVKNSLTSNESSNDSSLSRPNLASNLLEVEPDNLHHQSAVVTKEGNYEYTTTLPETESPHSNRVSNSLDDIMESEISRDSKLQQEYGIEDLRTSAADNIDGNEFEETSQDQLKNELIHSPSYPDPTGQNSGAVDDSHTGESGLDTSGTSTVNLQGEADNHSIQHQLDAAKGDASKSSSQSDSLDGQWGSVAVFSTRSDNPAVIDTENSPSTGSHPFEESEKANSKKPSVVASEQYLDKSDEFEPPSFSTLVEPGIQDTQNTGAAPPQVGWFPSITHAANESQERKKNEEMIEKVTNWNTKQHIPLKSLLGEAINESRLKSPIEPLRDEKVVVKDNNGVMVTKVSSILGPESPEGEAAGVESVKEEWNSPARYHQAHIRREKRKVKGRPLWAQFVCCSSLN